jgi:transposase
MAVDNPRRALNEHPPTTSLDDAIEQLMSVLFWLDASGRPWAALDVNNALEKLLREPTD